MWAIRVLNGALAGTIYPLKKGKNAIGRASHCEVRLQAFGISKEHAQVFLTDDKIILTDLNSRNGTFVNGLKIQTHRINPKDKIAFNDTLLEILKLPDHASPRPPQWGSSAAPKLSPQMQHQMSPQTSRQLAPQLSSQIHQLNDEPETRTPQDFGDIIQNLKNNLDTYIENVALPGVYKFSQSMEYRWVIGIFIGVFILMVTALSTVPMNFTISNSIEAECIRRAITIARGLAQVNRQAIIENLEVSVSTRNAEIEDGVAVAAIISATDGHVIAPANLRQQDTENPFFREARREPKEYHKSLGRSLIGASSPIIYYDPQRGEQTPIAYAVVIYDMSAVGIRTEQSFSLFVETLAIALVFGLMLYFVLMRVIEHPITTLNNRLDEALREGHEDLHTDYKYPLLENLAANVNSALSRSQNPSQKDAPQINLHQRHTEAASIVSMIENPALAISAHDSKIIAANTAFDRLLGSNLVTADLLITELTDPALKQNIIQMIHSLRLHPEEKILSEIPFDGITHSIFGQSIFSLNEPVYFLFSIQKNQNEGGQ